MDSLANHFLIAMPRMDDPQFHHTVIYICEHNDQGAMGLVINRSLNLELSAILHHVNVECDRTDVNRLPILWGGPANSDQMFTLHSAEQQWESTLALKDNLAMTTSKDILEALAAGKGPEKILITLGFAGWEAGQLENELLANIWLTAPADYNILFNLELDQRRNAAARRVGVDFTYLSDETGHA